MCRYYEHFAAVKTSVEIINSTGAETTQDCCRYCNADKNCSGFTWNNEGENPLCQLVHGDPRLIYRIPSAHRHVISGVLFTPESK